MAQEAPPDRRGIYNVEYFSGTQASIYIGDVWVDEITSFAYSVQQSRVPLYGYADELFRDVSKGQVIVQGQFTINFKEAGYLFLILDRYRQVLKGRESVMRGAASPFLASDIVNQVNIERLINGEISVFERNKVLRDLADLNAQSGGQGPIYDDFRKKRNELGASFNQGTGATAAASLGGFASDARQQGGVGSAENLFEVFEDAVWQKPQEELDAETRRPDDTRLNPFDIYLTFGDFAGNNSANHTIQKLSEVHIIGSAKQLVPDGQPIQEVYTFIARNLV